MPLEPFKAQAAPKRPKGRSPPQCCCLMAVQEFSIVFL